ncbi:polyamine-transporting ATPase 13A3-like [Amphiura filiformis]|uniref:polyamine-transporting ATPase 13A3-like n=1 Tax=Amphiura filiformis TaxID=82378 RepID=UPI003B21A414
MRENFMMKDIDEKRLPSHVTVEKQKGELIDCWGYKTNEAKTIACYIFGVLTVGFLFLVFYWKPDWKLKATSSRCMLQEADWVLVKDMYQRFHVSKIQRQKASKNGPCPPEVLKEILRRDAITNDELRLFKFQKMMYVWDPKENTFFPLRALEVDIPVQELLSRYGNGISEKEAEERRFLYGANEIFIRVRPILVLLVQEVLNPFYIFQIFSVTVWIADEYYYYSGCIILMSAISIAISLYTTRTQNVTLRAMVESHTTVQVQRLNTDTQIDLPEQRLVPGDVIHIPTHGGMMTCDAVLISGNCIVNEGMLTGESVPVTKTSLSSAGSSGDANELYSSDTHKRNTLFCGTQVLQTRPDGSQPVKAIVVQTGFATTKGSLVRSILFPKPMEIKLHRDALRFVGCLAFLAFLGFIYAIVIMKLGGASVENIILRSLDIITIAVPPALPAALTIGMVYAQLRLKAASIFCISPQRINISGSIDVVCFDKTGTLTEDGLDLMGVRRSSKARFLELEVSVDTMKSSDVIAAMATCHSLAIIDDEIVGDPLDIKMFNATKMHLNEPDGSGRHFMSVSPGMHEKKSKEEISIVKQFPFSSALQRMSVLTHVEDAGHMTAYVKGSPEMIASLSLRETIPAEFNQVLDSYAREGFRVLALASTIVDALPNQAREIKRNDVEKDLIFIGLMVMQNKLKPETTGVIQVLKEADIRTVMITGDNILTAINIARKCQMCEMDDVIVRIDMEAGSDDDEKAPVLTYTVVESSLTDADPTECVKEVASNDVLLNVENRDKKQLYALDGRTFAAIRRHHQHVIPNIVSKGLVLARMSPDQKQEFVEYLEEYQFCVGMCGDGANDCGALKTAHAGISLSEAEASVASPFTSKIQNISCVPMLIKEGRAALVTSFAMFKYMALYSMIQFTSVLIIYSVNSTLSDLMFHYIDICLCTVTVLLMSRGGAYEKLSLKKPLSKLMKAPIIFSMAVHIVIQGAFQIAIFYIIQVEPWFIPLDPDPHGKNNKCFETTSVFLLSCFQYIIVAFIFTPGVPYRQPIYKQYLYTAALVFITIITILLVMVAPPQIERILQIQHIPDYLFKAEIIGVAALHLVIACIIEYVIVPSEKIMKLVGCVHFRKPKKDRYQQLQMDIMDSPSSHTSV